MNERTCAHCQRKYELMPFDLNPERNYCSEGCAFSAGSEVTRLRMQTEAPYRTAEALEKLTAWVAFYVGYKTGTPNPKPPKP